MEKIVTSINNFIASNFSESNLLGAREVQQEILESSLYNQFCENIRSFFLQEKLNNCFPGSLLPIDNVRIGLGLGKDRLLKQLFC